MRADTPDTQIAAKHRLEAMLGGDIVYPRGDSNARHRLRRPVLYPLSYGGIVLARTRGPSVSQRPVFCKFQRWVPDSILTALVSGGTIVVCVVHPGWKPDVVLERRR